MTLYIHDGLLVRVGDNLATSEDCCCFDDGICHYPTEWRVVDATDHVYADGTVVLAENGTELLMQQRPDLLPEAYPAAGDTDYRLQVQDHHADPGGSSGWVTIAEWSHDLDVCTSRYAEWPEGPWEQPEHWSCKVDPDTLEPLESCDPCDQTLTFGGDPYAPENGVGVTFTGSVDGEWTNLANWEDANSNTPAGTLPEAGDDVTIEGSVTSTFGAIEVGDLTIADDGEFHVAATVTNLYCDGLIGRDGVCDGVIGHVTCSGACEFDGGTLAGEVTANGNAATFINAGNVTAEGIVNGDAILDGGVGTDNFGVITGDGIFRTAGVNYGTVGGDGTFEDNANNAVGVVAGNAVFRGDAYNIGTVNGNAEFEDDAVNGDLGEAGAGLVIGNAEFSDQSKNLVGNSVNGNATFVDTSRNEGTVDGDGTFGGDATNASTGTVAGNAVFSGTADNVGSVTGNATFSDTATMQGGDVTGTATFTDSACYVAGTAGAFVPDPPPDC